MRIVIYCAVFFSILSCRQKMVKVYMDNKVLLNNNVFIDEDTIPLRAYPHNFSYFKMRLNTGKHFVRLGKGESREFSVEEEGGILNAGNREYVIFPIKYTNPEGIDISLEANFPIVIDSFVVYDRLICDSQDKLIDFLSREDIADFLSRDLIKTPSDQIFIDKVWDYELDEIPANEITVETIKGTEITAVGYRNLVMDSKSFLSYALNSSSYRVEVLKKGNEARIKEALNKLD